MIYQRLKMMIKHWDAWKHGFRYCRKCKGWHYKQTVMCDDHPMYTYYFD